MAETNKLSKIAAERDQPLDKIIPAAIEEHGSIHWAAVSLRVSPNAIKYWLKKNGYSVHQKLVTVVTKEEAHV
jgi:hypothetical protein